MNIQDNLRKLLKLNTNPNLKFQNKTITENQRL